MVGDADSVSAQAPQPMLKQLGRLAGRSIAGQTNEAVAELKAENSEATWGCANKVLSPAAAYGEARRSTLQLKQGLCVNASQISSVGNLLKAAAQAGRLRTATKHRHPEQNTRTAV